LTIFGNFISRNKKGPFEEIVYQDEKPKTFIILPNHLNAFTFFLKLYQLRAFVTTAYD